MRGREIWDWVEAVLDFCKNSPQKGRCLAVQLYPSAGGKRADPQCEMVVVVVVAVVLVVVVVVVLVVVVVVGVGVGVVVEPLVSYIYYGCCP